MWNIWVVNWWYCNLNNKVLIDICLLNLGIINIGGNGI
jgi:hypothetical protein